MAINLWLSTCYKSTLQTESQWETPVGHPTIAVGWNGKISRFLAGELDLTSRILDGRAISAQIEAELAADVKELLSKGFSPPRLAAVLVGEDAASEVYVRNKRKACDRVGLASELHRLPADTSQSDLLGLVNRLNQNDLVDGILVQLPLPSSIDDATILDAISPHKDVDSFHPENFGLLAQGRPRFIPCTPQGVMEILARNQILVAGKRAVVIGRSEIVGKPMAMLLGAKSSPWGADCCNATVTICHARTNNTHAHTLEADILVVAAGKPELVRADMVKPGAVVIDVGIHRTETGLCGDVHFDSVKNVASAITPVPGGVGPMTITMLLRNTIHAAKLRRKES